MGVGMPQEIQLRQFGTFLYDAFGAMPYHVGSSLRQKDGWRDVDVRLLLDDDVWEREGLGHPDRPQENAKWVATTLAWSTFGRVLTGLPVDFQLQQRTYANEKFTGLDHQRSALFDISLVHKFGKVAEGAAKRALADANVPDGATR
jgi:hypothetical protein